MRSKLFVPGSRPEFFDKAMASAADGISFDLEDAVAPSMKAQARETLARYLGDLPTSSKTLVVRINDQDSPHYAADLNAMAATAIDVINLPKVESPAQITQLAAELTRLERDLGRTQPIRILANIESAKGLRQAAEIGRADPRVMGLQLGFADLLEPLGIERRELNVVRQLQLTLRLAAGEANVAAYDAMFGVFKDTAFFAEEAAYARKLGFTGKSCIHPSQIPIANQTFLPSAEEIEHAQQVIATTQRHAPSQQGTYQLDGQMIDLPFVRRAERVLAQAKQAGLLPA